MVVFLTIIAFLAVLIGTFQLTQATVGVGIICIGCATAIFARIAQESAHHKQLLNKISDSTKKNDET